jgi:ubiquinone biosynthesis accessory factor UbiJ
LNQFLGSLVLIPIEKVLNALINRDAHIARQFATFDGKCIEIVSQQPAASLVIQFQHSAIKLSAIDSLTLGIEADASICGKAEDLLRLLVNASKQTAMADAAIDISGDAELVQDLHRTIDLLDIQWQDYLAPFVGDIISNGLGDLERSTRDWSKHAGDSLQRTLHNYLSEEARLVPSKMEVESFSNRLDQLRLRLDRALAQSELHQRRLSLLIESK